MPSTDAKAPGHHERRVLLYALLSGLPAIVVSLVWIWNTDFTPRARWTLTPLLIGLWLGFALAARERVVYSLRTLSNLLAALREGDYSLRAHVARHDALGEVMQEVNRMGEMLREQRLSALEATQLLRKVVQEIDVAVFTFDAKGRLLLVNRASENLLRSSAEKLLGHTAQDLHLAEFLSGQSPRTVQRTFPGGAGRWRVVRSRFHEEGVPHQLLVISDLTRELREEELQAWQRLVRVLSHELNNSLAPIKSIAGSLQSLAGQTSPPPDWKEDLRQGLAVIGSRADALSRFTSAYAHLAKLPQPKLEPVNIGECVRRVVQLETAKTTTLDPGPDLTVEADPAQLEQVMINLVRNAVEAAGNVGGDVRIGWTKNGSGVEVWVRDDGPGLSSESNLFVPFFTTKPGGSGIGLVLSRKIAENHGGELTLENRKDRAGCVARLRLPLAHEARAVD